MRKASYVFWLYYDLCINAKVSIQREQRGGGRQADTGREEGGDGCVHLSM